MPKRIKHRKQPVDVNQSAHLLVQQSTAVAPETLPATISEYMATIGRKGGKIGGKRRLTTLSEKERKKIASDAAKARWQRNQKVES